MKAESEESSGPLGIFKNFWKWSLPALSRRLPFSSIRNGALYSCFFWTKDLAKI